METETPGSKQAPRVWLLAVLGVVLIGLIAYQMWPDHQEPESATPATASSNPGRAGRGSRDALDPADLKVRLDALQAQRPDPGDVERNPFRFKPPPAPPAPRLPQVAETPTVPSGPPPPPPIPQ